MQEAKRKDPYYYRKYGTNITALEILQDINLSNQTILITGSTSGIGAETVSALSSCGAHIIMANRNLIQSKQLRDSIYQTVPSHGQIDIIYLDLSSLQSVQMAAKTFLATGFPLHVLILNAGVVAPKSSATMNGYESTFAINHLGHFYLTYLLLNKLRASIPSRLVVVSSALHTLTGINAKLSTEEKLIKLIPSPHTNQFAWRLYAYAKLCNVLFAQKIHHSEFQNHIHTYVLHPGFIKTNIFRNYNIFEKTIMWLLTPFTKTLQQGAATTCFCAASPEVANASGKFYKNCWEDEKGFAKKLTHDSALQNALWDKSMEMIKKFEKEQMTSAQNAT